MWAAEFKFLIMQNRIISKFNLLVFYFKARRLYSININLESCIRSMQLQLGILNHLSTCLKTGKER